MRIVLFALVSNLAAMMCFGVSAYLAIHSKAGWGWFLFVGLLCVSSVISEKTK